MAKVKGSSPEAGAAAGSAASAPDGGSKKVLTLSFLWEAMVFAYMIRFALGIVAPVLMKTYHITPKMMGYILSGWNWTYTGGFLIVGSIVDRFGPWVVMGVGSLLWGLSTIALPIASAATSLFTIRMLFGLAHSPLIPANAAAIARKFSVSERARAIAVSFSGNQVGLAVGGPIAAFILAHLGWKAVFYVIGGASLVWTVAWVVAYPDKRVGEIPAAATATSGPTKRASWLSLLRYRSTWGISFGQMGYLYAFFFFVNWLPTYLVHDRKMTILKSGFVSAIPFWAGLLGTVGGGWLADSLIRRGVNTTVCRKSIIGVGMGASTVFVIAAAYVESSWLAVTLLALCVGFLRLATGSVNSTPLDLAPRSVVGSLTAVQNFFGNIGGLLAPIVTGYIVDRTGSFVDSLLVAGGMALMGALSYVFLMGNLETRQIPG